MGFALPAAMGAKLAQPKKLAVAVEGDGSFLMNNVELSTAVEHSIPVVVVVLNNYGWRVWEGRSRYTPGQQVNAHGTLVFPIVVYSHSQGCSITGGYVYRGKAVPAARGRYFYGDYCNGTIWSLRASGAKLTSGPRREPFTVGNLSSFGEDAAGELYATSLDGTVYKLSP